VKNIRNATASIAATPAEAARSAAADEPRAPGRSRRDQALEGRINSFELAFRMQTAMPEIQDLADETEATQRLYGSTIRSPRLRPAVPDGPAVRGARRAVRAGDAQRHERAVGPARQSLEGAREERQRGRQADRRLARDLKARGLLDDTLVLWGGEFGRTPTAQGTDGRDHNPQASRCGWPAAA
jgi:hypothetical protein